jgi:type IV secretory pathway ATPase VirB11/archaellum biosynthesis ATPase
MPGIGIGIGFNKEQIRTLMKELCIKPEREDALMEMFSNFAHTESPIDDLQRVIALSTKANEVTFLSFLVGILFGSQVTIAHLKDQLPELVQSSLIVGAEHSDEIKELVKAMKSEGQTPITATGENSEEIQNIINKIQSEELGITPEKKKKNDPPDDPMYR